MMSGYRSVTAAEPLRDKTGNKPGQENQVFYGGPDQAHPGLRDAPGSPQRGAPIGGCFRLRSLLRLDFFLSYSGKFLSFLSGKARKRPGLDFRV